MVQTGIKNKNYVRKKNEINTKASTLLCINSTGKPIYLKKKEPKHSESQANNKSLVKSDQNLNIHSQLKSPERSSTPIPKENQNMNNISHNNISNASSEKNDQNELMTQSFLDKFFNNETSFKKANKLEKVDEFVLVEKTENQNDVENDDKNSFIDFFFDSKSTKSLLNNSSEKMTPKVNEFKDNEINSIISYLSNLKLKNKLCLKAINNYIDLYETLSDSKVQNFLSKRSNTSDDCLCIQNALGCCLRKIHSNIESIDKQKSTVFDECCQECKTFSFYYFRKERSQMNLSELEMNKFETEEPDWFKDLNDLKRLNFIDQVFKAHNKLRTPNVHEFLVQSNKANCKCLQRIVVCCIKKMYESINESSNNNLKAFLEYDCCLDCLNESHDKKQSLSAQVARNVFANKQNSKSSSLDEPTTKNSNENSTQEDFEKKPISEENVIKNESVLELSLKEEINENSNNSDSKHSFIELFFESKKQSKSPSICSRSSQCEKKTENQSAVDTNVQNEPIVSQSLPTSSISMPISSQSLPLKSMLKQNERKKPGKSVQKSHNVTFYDEKFGFQTIKLEEWQENFRDPVYSKSKLLPTEWKTEVIKNDYEYTKELIKSLKEL